MTLRTLVGNGILSRVQWVNGNRTLAYVDYDNPRGITMRAYVGLTVHGDLNGPVRRLRADWIR